MGPGACPICGMALEPRTVSVDETNGELEDITRRFWASALITAPILAFMVSEFIPGQPLQRVTPHGWLNWIESALATPVVLWGGVAVLRARLGLDRQPPSQYVHAHRARRRRGVRLQRRRHACSGRFPDSFRMNGAVAVYFEPAAVIVVLVLLGQVLELRARSQTSTAIRHLLGLAPKTARRLETDGSEHDIPLDQVHVGDRLRVRPGERVPVDGVVVAGATTIDESMVTGEPMPVEKAADAAVTGGHRERDRARSSWMPGGSGATPCSPRSSAWSVRHSAPERRSSASPTRCPAGSSRP